MSKVTSRTELTTPADGDLVHIVDIDDTTDSPEGSSKKITRENLVQGLAATSTTLGAVVHGTDPNVARPSGYPSVKWLGSVEPVNKAVADEWVEIIL